MRTIKTITLVAFLLLASVFILASSGGPSVPAAVNAEAGPAEIYSAHCARCHGGDGRAQTARGKRAGATDLTSDWNRDPARGVRIITNGKGQMPAFKSQLSAAEIKSVFNYVSRF